MRVLVCGGRTFSNTERLYTFLDNLPLNLQRPITLVIHGGATGADRLAGKWSKDRGVEALAFPAQWVNYGKSAGHIRNQQMLTEGQPELVVAFPGGKGTDDMIHRASRAGVAVLRG